MRDITSYELRGKKVLVSEDLAELFGVSKQTITKAVQNNPSIFSSDVAFLLTDAEMDDLCLKGSREYAFTEVGLCRLSFALDSQSAILLSIAIIRYYTTVGSYIRSNGLDLLAIDNLPLEDLMLIDKFFSLYN